MPVSAAVLFDPDAAIPRAQRAYQAMGNIWTSGGTGYSVMANISEVTLKPLATDGGNGRVAQGTPLVLRSAKVYRQGWTASAISAGRMAPDGHLVLSRGSVEDHLRDAGTGIEQSWVFVRRPVAALPHATRGTHTTVSFVMSRTVSQTVDFGTEY